MRLKSYFAGSVEAAISLAARELGDEAMLVYSREAAAEARYLGRYEVVFALPESAGHAEPDTHRSGANAQPAPRAPAPSLKPQAISAAQETGFDQVRQEMQALKAQLAALAARVGPRQPNQAPEDADDGGTLCSASGLAARIEHLLNAAEVPADLTRRVLEAWKEDALKEDGRKKDAATENTEKQDVHDHDSETVVASDSLARLGRILERMVTTDASLDGPSGGCRVVAIIGPPGVGKTTALVKLAARYGLAARRPTLIINFDNLRIAGAEQLRTFAAILGVGFQALETAGALVQALEEHRNKQLILIDTAGISGDQEEAEELARLFAAHPEIDVHLALSAAMKPADLTRVADRFARLRPNKLLFTRLDETSTFGPLWAEAVVRALPISFLSEGQQIPEDLRAATSEQLSGLVLGDSFRDREKEALGPPLHPTGTKASLGSSGWNLPAASPVGADDSAAVAA